MWIDTILDSWIDFITMVIGFGVAIIGVLSKTTLEDKKWPKNITRFGWILVFFAIINLSFSWYQNFQKSKKQEIVRYWAILEIEQATCDLMIPYFLNSDPPNESSRFNLSEYLINPDIAMGVCETNLLDSVGRDYHSWGLGNSTDSWADVFTKHAERGNQKLKLILTNYSSILAADTILLIGILTTHPWLEFVKDSKNRTNRLLERKPKSNHSTLGSHGKLLLRYVELAVDFGKKIALLEKNIKDQHDNLYSRLDRDDPLPLFYRRYSGFYYLPDLSKKSN